MRSTTPWAGAGRVAVVAAHPDDETIGAGGHFPQLCDALFIHVTDGAPRNGRDATASGFATPADYARARAGELAAALALAGIDHGRRRDAGLGDQESTFHLCDLARTLARFFREDGTGAVLTHPYEGGHPDHDSTAFAVRAACRLIEKEGGNAPEILEFTSYHNRDGQIETGEFLANADFPEVLIELSEPMRHLKRRMFACHATQRRVLEMFPIGWERFRRAPAYDFSAPPHAGQLHYERFDWGVDGARWRELAAQATRRLRF